MRPNNAISEFLYFECRYIVYMCATDISASNLYGDMTDEEGQTLGIMTSNDNRAPLVIRFMDTKPRMLMEITNATTTTLKSVEILTVFLKDEQGSAAPLATFRFDPQIQFNKRKGGCSHRTWINGRQRNDAQDQIGRQS